MNKRESDFYPLFLLLLIGQKKRSHIPTLLCLSLSLVEHIYIPLLLEKRDNKERECVCVRVNDDDDEKKVS